MTWFAARNAILKTKLSSPFFQLFIIPFPCSELLTTTFSIMAPARRAWNNISFKTCEKNYFVLFSTSIKAKQKLLLTKSQVEKSRNVVKWFISAPIGLENKLLDFSRVMTKHFKNSSVARALTSRKVNIWFRKHNKSLSCCVEIEALCKHWLTSRSATTCVGYQDMLNHVHRYHHLRR